MFANISDYAGMKGLAMKGFAIVSQKEKEAHIGEPVIVIIILCENLYIKLINNFD